MRLLMIILIFDWFDYLGIFEQYFIICTSKIFNYFYFRQTKKRFCLFKNQLGRYDEYDEWPYGVSRIVVEKGDFG